MSDGTPAGAADADDAPAGEASTEEPPAADAPPTYESGDGGNVEDAAPGGMPAVELARIVEALLFLSPDPVPIGDLVEACEADEVRVRNALDLLAEELAPGRRGLVLREAGGGWSLATDPAAELPARRLLARPKTPPLTQAQAETLAIVAYLQPVSRPEIARIRGVSSESGVQTLSERGLIEEAGRSRFGAVIYRTTDLFERLFGLRGLDELPDVASFDPTPEDAAELRERLLRAGEQRAEPG